MKTIQHITASIVLASMFLSFTGRTFHLHYCLSSQKYSIDFHKSTNDNCVSHYCSCCSKVFQNPDSENGQLCCRQGFEESSKASCCLDFLVSSDSDKEYNYATIGFNLSPATIILLNFPEPIIDDFLTDYTYSFYKYRDTAPPEIITKQVLLI